jgi:hypothetical protein
MPIPRDGRKISRTLKNTKPVARPKSAPHKLNEGNESTSKLSSSMPGITITQYAAKMTTPAQKPARADSRTSESSTMLGSLAEITKYIIKIAGINP